MEKYKLLLLFPNYANWAIISSAIPILAGIAKERNWEVEYFDTWQYEKTTDSTTEKEMSGGFKSGFINEKQKQLPNKNIVIDLQNKIDNFKPDVIAITALSEEYYFLLSFLPKINTKESIVIIGGIHTTLLPKEVTQTNLFNLVCVGEGEETFNELLERVENKQSFSNIKNTYMISKNNIHINDRRYLLTSDKLWDVDLNFSFFNDKYFIRPFNGKMIRRYDMIMGRGCPYNCTYCGNSALKKINKGLGKFVRVQNFDSMFKQIKTMINDYKIDIFQFLDECFLSHPKTWLKEFSNRYNKEGKPFIIQTRPETITEEKIKILLKTNVPFQISVGVESGSEKILNNICNRKCKKEHIIKAFKILQKYHIRNNAFFMIGMPFETRKDYFNTIELCRKIRPSVMSIAIFQPLPGQELTKLCIEKKFITGKEPMATFTSKSLLNMPKPYLQQDEIKNLWRVFALYCCLPKKYYPNIKKCEKNFNENKELYNELITLRWNKYDYSTQRKEMRLV